MQAGDALLVCVCVRVRRCACVHLCVQVCACTRVHELFKLMNLVTNFHEIWYKHAVDSWFQTFAVFWMLYAFFWVIPRRLNFIRHFGTICLFHLHRQVGMKYTFIPTCLWRWNRQIVLKCQHIKFWRPGITQKKANNKPLDATPMLYNLISYNPVIT